MTNSKLLLKDLISQITLPESREEIESIAYAIIETLFGLTRTGVMLEKGIDVRPEEHARLLTIIERINANEPLQYVLGEALFYGRIFKVTPSVLIPRPETELLIDAVKDYAANVRSPLRILDIGTGSGCIPVTLALELPAAQAGGIDVSSGALTVAKDNAERYGAPIQLKLLDILQDELSDKFDVIVSNPPYVAESEKAAMSPNVLEYEPHLALFVSDADPLVFYRSIAGKALSALRYGGLLAMEINERFGKETAALFESSGFTQIEITKDYSGKDRIVSGIRPEII